jgi:hypothetical protein
VSWWPWKSWARRRREMSNTVIPLTVSLAEHRSLEARHDDLYERYTAVCQALHDLVDALMAAQSPYPGGLYG